MIQGGKRLHGKIRISGAKNAALPIIAATLLSPAPKKIKNVPDVVDIRTMIDLLRHLGAQVQHIKEESCVYVNPKELKTSVAPYEIVKKMRASYYVLGSLLGRVKKAKVSLPGGCAIGARPIDLHLKGLQALSAEIKVSHGYVNAQARNLKGATIFLLGSKGTSVGATINVMMAATRANGLTTITPAACEPEVVDVADFLNMTGADIKGAGTQTITINGVKEMHEIEYEIIPDRIEAGTFCCAAAITKGRVEINSCRPEHLTSVIESLKEIGTQVKICKDRMTILPSPRPRPLNAVVAPYPGFPTDLQAQFMALLCLAHGQSTITETIFENRFMQALELMRMGALIKLKDNMAIISGVARLTGAKVMASDLRASAALVLAGLAAHGETEVSRIYHLDRGYEKFEQKLSRLGANIKRIG